MRGPGAAPYKLSLCKFWLEGRCERGDKCTWLHDDEKQEALEAAVIKPIRPTAQVKQTLCKFFERGACERGDQCTWLHDEGQLQDRDQTPAPAIPVKRTLCKFFEQGTCERGDQCTWAHGVDEIGALILPAEEPDLHDEGVDSTEDELEAEIPPDDAEVTAVKRTICKFWQEGRCRLGDQCTWAHGEEELGLPILEASMLEDEHAAAEGTSPSESEPLIAPSMKRTTCKFWQQGACERGEACTWAHGEEGLPTPVNIFARNVDQGSSPGGAVRRTLCKFWKEGTCERGEACTWAHGYEELGTIVPMESAAVARTPARPSMAALPGPAVHGNSRPSGKGSSRNASGALAVVAVAAAKGTGRMALGDRADGVGNRGRIVVPAEPAGPTEKAMCKFWQQGLCERGDACTWPHGEEEAGSAMVRRTLCKFWQQGQCDKVMCTWAHGEQEIGTIVGTQERERCKFFAMGQCTRGEACHFAHEAAWEGEAQVGMEKRAKCKFFAVGQCTRGEGCQFLHEMAREREARAPSSVGRAWPSVTPTKATRSRGISYSGALSRSQGVRPSTNLGGATLAQKRMRLH